MGQELRPPTILPMQEKKCKEIKSDNFYFFWSFEKLIKYISNDNNTKTRRKNKL